MTIQWWQSLIIALWVGLIMSRSLGLPTLHFRDSPLMTGLICGLVMGDVPRAIQIAATLQIAYMGTIGPGGSAPSEPCVATAVAVPTALIGNLSPEAALTIALPVGILSAYLYTFRFFVNSFFMKKVDDAAAKADNARLNRTITLYPFLTAMLIFVPLVFVVIQFGAGAVAEFLNTAGSARLFHVLDVIGGGLAAVGIGAAIYVIGKNEYMPFFILAYFFTVLFRGQSIPTTVYCFIGGGAALVYIRLRNEARESALAASGYDDDDDED